MAREKLYKNLTIKERMILFLKATGWVEIDSKNKYVMFERKNESSTAYSYLFIGKSGAVRSNTTKSATTSYSRTDLFASMLQTYEIGKGLI